MNCGMTRAPPPTPGQLGQREDGAGYPGQQRARGWGGERSIPRGMQPTGTPGSGRVAAGGVICNLTRSRLAHCRKLGFHDDISTKCFKQGLSAASAHPPPPPAALRLCSRCAQRRFIASVREKRCQITKLPQVARARSTQWGEKC